MAAVMLDARVFLILAMNEIACTASRAVPARAGQEANPDPLTHDPTLDPLTQRVDPADHLMAGYTRPGDREHAGDRRGVAMTDPTSLDTDADIAGRRFAQRLCCEFELSRRDSLDCLGAGRAPLRRPPEPSPAAPECGDVQFCSQPVWWIIPAGTCVVDLPDDRDTHACDRNCDQWRAAGAR